GVSWAVIRPYWPVVGAMLAIAGASSGIGRVIAIAFARAGAAVIVNYRSDEQAARGVVAEIERNHGQALAVRADISKPPECDALIDAARRELGGLDVLIANAGIQRGALIADMTLDQWRQVIDVNLTGQFLCAQAAARQFRRQPRAANASPALGNIIFMSSVHQAIPWSGHANYAS